MKNIEQIYQALKKIEELILYIIYNSIVLYKMVKVITDKNEIPLDKNVIVDFSAEWCGPCKRIAPDFEELSKKNTNVVFLKVDVDSAEKLAEAYEISALPTFLFFIKGVLMKRMEGANLKELTSFAEGLNS
jgi:thioredoxin